MSVCECVCLCECVHVSVSVSVCECVCVRVRGARREPHWVSELRTQLSSPCSCDRVHSGCLRPWVREGGDVARPLADSQCPAARAHCAERPAIQGARSHLRPSGQRGRCSLPGDGAAGAWEAWLRGPPEPQASLQGVPHLWLVHRTGLRERVRPHGLQCRLSLSQSLAGAGGLCCLAWWPLAWALGAGGRPALQAWVSRGHKSAGTGQGEARRDALIPASLRLAEGPMGSPESPWQGHGCQLCWCLLPSASCFLGFQGTEVQLKLGV